MSYDTVPAQAGTATGFVGKTIGPNGSNYPISRYNNDLGAATLQFLKDSLASFNASGFYFRGIILAGLYEPTSRVQIPAGTTYLWLEGEGEGVTVIQPPRNSGAGNDIGPAWLGTDSLSTPLLYHVDKMTYDGTRQTANPPAATAVTFPGSGVAYIHGTTGTTRATTRALVQFTGIAAGGGNISACSFTPALGAATDLLAGFGATVLAAILSSGYPMNVGDSITITDVTDTITMAYQYNNEFVEITTQAWQTGAEKSAQVDWENVEATGTLHVGVPGVGTQLGVNRWHFAFRGVEDSHFKFGKSRSASAASFGSYLIECYNGSFYVDGGNFGQLSLCGNSPICCGFEVGNGGVVITGNGPGAVQTYTFQPKYANGVTSTTGQANIHVNAQAAVAGAFLININLVGCQWVRQSGSGTTDAFISAATTGELAQVAVDCMGPTFIGTSATSVLARTTGGTAAPLSSVQGSFQIGGSCSIATFTAQFTKNCFVLVSKTNTLIIGPAPTLFLGNQTPTLAVTTTALFQLGLGAAGTPTVITPQLTGIIRFRISGTVKNSGANGVQLRLTRGTGAAPANGAAQTGTLSGASRAYAVLPGAADAFPCELEFIFTGTVGTTYWWDLAAGNVSSASTTLTFAIDVTLEEKGW